MSSAEIKAKHAKLKKPPASARRGRTRPSASKLVKAKDPLFPRKQIRQIAHKMRVVGAAARLQGMIYAGTKQEIETKRKAFIRKWRLKCEAVTDSLEEAGDKVFTSRASRKANGNRSARRMGSSDCMKSSSGGSRPRPCCPRRKQRPCCFGLCWLLARSR